MKKQSEMVVKNYKNVATNMTGGLDSRMVLASYLAIGAKPILLYGIGNSFSTNTYKEDLKIKYNLELIIMNWKFVEVYFYGIEISDKILTRFGSC
ncbi:MAG: hypothetical protein ACRC6A_11750 [Fusobacteriaceae bacterium]